MTFLDWLYCLISFDTTSRNSNAALIKDLEKWFIEHHISYRLTQNDKGDKFNLFASLPGEGGSMNDGLILSGHTDVVPVDGQVWETDPFAATQIGDKIYGRGTADMKGFLAVVLALVPQVQKITRKKPIHFAFTFDEEVGCRGAPLMIEDFHSAHIKPSACIVGEPSQMQPVVANKGISLYRCVVTGRATHSSLTPQGCNAIDYAAELITYIREIAHLLAVTGPLDKAFDVPFSTLSTNVIRGGTADNIIPASCEFFFELRNLPQIPPDKIIEQIKQYAQTVVLPKMQHKEAEITFKKIGFVPSFESPPTSEIERLVQEVSGEKTKTKVAYATEAGIFQAANIPAVICGPGNIEQAHRPNEYVTISQLKSCEKFLLEVIGRYVVN